MTYALTLEQPRTRAGLRDAVRAEWRKLVSLRSTAWALLITLAGTVLVSYLSARGARHTHVPAGFYQGFDPTNTALAGLALGSLVMGILGVMSMTGEYGSGTIRSSLAAVPRRGVFFSAKVIVFGAAALVIGMAMSFLSFFVGQAEPLRWCAHSDAGRSGRTPDPGRIGRLPCPPGPVRRRPRRHHPSQRRCDCRFRRVHALVAAPVAQRARRRRALHPDLHLRQLGGRPHAHQRCLVKHGWLHLDGRLCHCEPERGRDPAGTA